MWAISRDKLAKDLLPLLKDQVVIRYGVSRRYGSIFFEADLITQYVHGRHTYLLRFKTSYEIDRTIDIGSEFRMWNLADHPNTLKDVINEWELRAFDDWLHPRPFMGAYGVYRDGQACTSIKLDAHDERWLFLTGAIVGEFERFDAPGSYIAEGFAVLKRRFYAFAAQNECVWANRVLTAR